MGISGKTLWLRGARSHAAVEISKECKHSKDNHHRQYSHQRFKRRYRISRQLNALLPACFLSSPLLFLLGSLLLLIEFLMPVNMRTNLHIDLVNLLLEPKHVHRKFQFMSSLLLWPIVRRVIRERLDSDIGKPPYAILRKDMRRNQACNKQNPSHSSVSLPNVSWRKNHSPLTALSSSLLETTTHEGKYH